MDIQKRLLRRPLTTVLWQIVLIAMALLVGLSGTMVYASNQLTAIMDRHHTTIAVQTYHETVNEYGFMEPHYALMNSDVELLEGLDMVEKVDLRTLTGAYIPELDAQVALIPWGDLHQLNADYMLERSINDSYNQVAVVGTVEESWTVSSESVYVTDMTLLGMGEAVDNVLHYAILNVEEILALNKDFDILPTEEWSSYTGQVFVQVLSYDTQEEPWFQPGQRYIVTGSYDPSAHGMGTSVPHTPEGVALPWIETYFRGDYSYGVLESDRIVCYRDYEVAYTSSVEYSDIEVVDSVGEAFPVVQYIDGTTEEFLAEHPEWAEQVEKLQMAQHTFPVLGTEALETMQYFVTGDASMAEGRMFSQEEYDTGAKVCVISESLAQANGVKLGDTISFSQYLVGEGYVEGNPSLPERYYDEDANEPSVGTRIIPDGFVTEDEQFTIVGIYRLSRSWQDTAFAFTPNTIFIPQKAQIEGGWGGISRTEKERVWQTHYSGLEMTPENITFEGWVEEDVLRPRGVYGVYMSVKLKNGTMAQFQEALEGTWLNGHQFLTFDQGFEEAQGSIRAVIDSAQKLFWLASGGWALLLMAYVLLNQSREKRNLGVMRSVGTTVAQTRRYLFAGGFVQALSGVAIGTALTGTVAALVQDKLIGLVLTTGSGSLMRGAEDLAGMLAQSEISALGLLILAVLQIAIIGVVLWTHAALLARKNTRKLLGV